MKSLGFEDAVVVLTTYLQKIREVCIHFCVSLLVGFHLLSAASTRPLWQRGYECMLQAEGAEKSAKSAAADSRDGAAGSMGTATPNMTMVWDLRLILSFVWDIPHKLHS